METHNYIFRNKVTKNKDKLNECIVIFQTGKMSGQGGKRKKSYYVNASKKGKFAGQGRVLAEDMKGFLITCNNRCKQAFSAWRLKYADPIQWLYSVSL